MSRTDKARHATAAERIIREAYKISRPSTARRVKRYELLSSGVALAIARDERNGGRTFVRVARRLGDGRAVQMRKECRNQFATLKDLLAYFDGIYARYGAPQ
jgi:hypothetical protein